MNNFYAYLDFKSKTKISTILSKFTKLNLNERKFKLLNSKLLSFEDLLFLNIEIDTNFKLTGYFNNLENNKLEKIVIYFNKDITHSNFLIVKIFLNDEYVFNNTFNLKSFNIKYTDINTLSNDILTECKTILLKIMLFKLDFTNIDNFKWKVEPLNNKIDNNLFISNTIKKLDMLLFNFMLTYFEWRNEYLSKTIN